MATSIPALGQLAIDIGEEDRDLASHRLPHEGRAERGESASHLEVDRVAHLGLRELGSG